MCVTQCEDTPGPLGVSRRLAGKVVKGLWSIRSQIKSFVGTIFFRAAFSTHLFLGANVHAQHIAFSCETICCSVALI